MLAAGVETKTTFLFSRKAKISKNSLTFREISFLRKILVPKMVFAKSFRFSENFPPAFRIWIHIQVAPESGPENSEWKILVKTFAKQNIFAKTFAKTFSKTKIFAKTFAASAESINFRE
jgi:hypothetical protein